MLRAWRDMCPRWIPSVARARRAAKFCARPTAAITSPSSCALFTPRRRTFALAVGWTAVAPPTSPTAIGSSMVPTKSPFASFSQVVRDRYPPDFHAAYACAPDSIARQSFPVARTTASTPFMIPLLCVAQRNGSASAKAYASRMPSTTSSPDRSSVLRTSLAKTARALARRRTARLEMIRKYTRPPVHFSRCGATASAIVFTAFAPHPRRIGGGGDHTRFLDRHRHEVVLPVDLKIHGDAEGDGHRADHVFDHVVDLLEAQSPGIPNRVNLGRLELPELANNLPSFVRAFLVEARDIRPFHRSTARGRGLSRHKGIAGGGPFTVGSEPRTAHRRTRRWPRRRRSSRSTASGANLAKHPRCPVAWGARSRAASPNRVDREGQVRISDREAQRAAWYDPLPPRP